MDFGRVPETDLDNVDFSLPKDPEGNKKVLEKSTKTATLESLLVAPSGEEKNGWERSIPPKQKTRSSWMNM
jgi:hypothetical protein